MAIGGWLAAALGAKLLHDRKKGKNITSPSYDVGTEEGAFGAGIGKGIDPNRIRGFMSPTQGLIDEQLGIGRSLMDPSSEINQAMKNLMTQRAAESGTQQMGQMRRMAAQGGVSPGQAMMQARMAMNDAMGGVNQNWMAQQQGQFTQGLGTMQNMGQMQQGLGEMYSNTYLAEANRKAAKRKKFLGIF